MVGTFHIITAVWGDEFIDLFLRVGVPNQLSAGNIAALPPRSRYRIFTRQADRQKIEDGISALRATLSVDIVTIADITSEKYDSMARCHQRALDEADGAALIFLAPDHVMATGTLAAVVRRRAMGYRAVVATGLRLAKKPFLDTLGTRRELANRELVSIALPHLHAHERAMLRHARPSASYPVAVHWAINDVGLLTRALHLHPLMIDPLTSVPLQGTIDGCYLADALPGPPRIHVVTDSDELQIFELTSASAVILKQSVGPMSRVRIAQRTRECSSFQLRYWTSSPIRIHSRDLDRSWHQAERDSARFAGQVMSMRWLAGQEMFIRWRARLGRERKRWNRHQKYLEKRRRLAARYLARLKWHRHQLEKRRRLAARYLARLKKRAYRRARLAIHAIRAV